MASVIEQKLTAATGSATLTDAIQRLSDDVVADCRGDSSTVCLRSLSKKLGVISIRREDLPCEALLVPLPGNEYEVLLSIRANRHRQRFSLAHELGHIILHRALPETRDFETRDVFMPPGHHVEEEICDRLAAEILMPRSRFLAELPDSDLSIASVQQLSQLFDVSLSAATNRCKDLLNTEIALAKFDVRDQSLYCTKLFVNFTDVGIYSDRQFPYPFSSIPGLALVSRTISDGWLWIREKWKKRRLFCSASLSSNENSILGLLTREPLPIGLHRPNVVNEMIIDQFEDTQEEAFV